MTTPGANAQVRALTVKQPWTACIASGHKTTENRTWSTRWRGTLFLHAGRGFDDAALGLELDATRVWAALREVKRIAPHAVERSAVIAIGRVIDCHLAQGCCAPWGEARPDVWHWALADITPLSEPVPARGGLGLWPPPPELIAAVYERLAGVR
jgi:hypothetical protein